MHGIRTTKTNGPPQNQYVIVAKKGTPRKLAHSNSGTKAIEDITEREKIKQSGTSKSMNIATEIKHVTDRRNHITMTLKIDGIEKYFIVDT